MSVTAPIGNQLRVRANHPVGLSSRALAYSGFTMQKLRIAGWELLIHVIRQFPPTLPERLLRPARLNAIVEVSLRPVRLPELLLLRIVLMDVGIAAVQPRRFLPTVGQSVMDHVSGVAGRPERLVDALRRQRIIGLRRIAYRHPGVTAEVP